ncbi:MAG: hypothetical protein M3Z64_01940 [Verrucomicrobiota bacterium]|nr:hypothetical protein [Verrucomicrobiota bacterium]
MPDLKDFVGSVTVLVSSCDAFFDVWRPFAFFFRKEWPACPFPVFLLTNELRISSKSIQPLSVGPDRGWATNLQIALEQIPTEYILYLQEDYFLTAPVRASQLAQDFADALTRGADSLCLRARTHREPDFEPLNDRFGVVPVDSDGRTRNQVTLWNRRKFASVLREGENGWDMEREGSERTRDLKILSYGRRENMPIPYLMSAIVRGLWTRDALELCRANAVAISPHFRSTYSDNSLVRGVRRSLTRRRAERALDQQKHHTLDLD